MLGFVFSLTSDFELLLRAIRSVTSDAGNKKRGEGYFVVTAEAVTPIPNPYFLLPEEGELKQEVSMP